VGAQIDLTNAVERAAVASVCRRLDGLPLALELGAAQLRTRSVIDLLDDLRTLDLPVTRRDLPARQRSLDAVLAWSEALLDPPSVAALRRLAVFRGSFDAAAAATVMAGAPIPAGRERAVLATLVEASLVVVERRPGSPLRYRLLETVRAHAEQRLVAAGERERTMAGLGRWSEQVVAAIEPLIRTPRQDEAMALAMAERLNIEPACEHAIVSGDHRRALRLAATVPIGLPAERRALLFHLLADDADAPRDAAGPGVDHARQPGQRRR
jgi:predicted ATPase